MYSDVNPIGLFDLLVYCLASACFLHEAGIQRIYGELLAKHFVAKQSAIFVVVV